MAARHVVGIDLGSTNSVISYVDPEAVVSLGAACYGWIRTNGAPRIRSGTVCSWNIGIETTGLAVRGAPRPLNALCVVPQGMEEGTSCEVPSTDIGLPVGTRRGFVFLDRQCDRKTKRERD